jgi:protein subunit release factor B
MSDWPVRSAKQKELEERMQKLGIRPEDLIEKFIHGSGPGGQKINKTASQVYLKHVPTGIEIKVQRSRSRELNRFLARRELCDRLEEKLLGAESKAQKAIFKIRKQKARRSRRSKEKMLEEKHKQAERKLFRATPGEEE